jgi:nitrate reductase gamma subunit
MDLLDFARGPALVFAVTVFSLGIAWRLVHLWRRPAMPDLSPSREGAPTPTQAAAQTILRAMWPRKAFSLSTHYVTLNGYVFHIGLAVIFFGYAPHIAFIQRIAWLHWPALPDMVMYVAAGATIGSLLLALVLRLTDPVRKLISGANDIITWVITFAPLITGMAVLNDPSATILARDHTVYRGPLAIHLLTLELLLIWFPFGKLMHAVLFAFSRSATGIRMSHRGVQV